MTIHFSKSQFMISGKIWNKMKIIIANSFWNDKKTFILRLKTTILYTKAYSYGDLHVNWRIYSEVTQKTSPNFSTLASGSAAIPNPRRHHIFSCVLKPDTGLRGNLSIWQNMSIIFPMERDPFHIPKSAGTAL